MSEEVAKLTSTELTDSNLSAVIPEVEQFYSRFLVLPSGVPLVLALWTLATYTFQVFDAFPYVVILSPTKRCGKTRVTEVMSLLVSSPCSTVNISEAALFRLIESKKPCLILDEAEALTGRSNRAESIRSILNAGNRLTASVPRCVGATHDIKLFRVFCPKVIVGIGNCPETIRDRSIVISMQRKRPIDMIERFKIRRVEPEARRLQGLLAKLAENLQSEIAAVFDAMDLRFLRDREAEAWEPIFAVCAVAEKGRLEELRVVAERLVKHKIESDEDDSLPLRLLSDIREVWPPGSPLNIFTSELLSRLYHIEDSPWGQTYELNARKLGRMLRPFSVKSRTVWIDQVSAKGYVWKDLETAFYRYLGPEKSESQEAHR